MIYAELPVIVEVFFTVAIGSFSILCAVASAWLSIVIAKDIITQLRRKS